MKTLFILLLIAIAFADNVEKQGEVDTQHHPEMSDHDKESKNYITIAVTSSFVQEWTERMSDYEPDYVYMIPIAYRAKEVYYEQITTVPARVRGAFLTDDEKKDKIEFSIMDAQDKVIYTATGNEHIFDFKIETAGRYKIVFYNKFLNSDIKVTFTMNADQNPILKKESLSFTETKLDSLVDFIKKFNLEFRFNRNANREKFLSKLFILTT
jgi:hypothetical protein